MATRNMTNKRPGVYMYEENVPGSIQGVSTSIAAFIGPATKGDKNTPTLITNWTQYENLFGGYAINKGDKRFFTPFAVKGYFENGGSILKFVRCEDSEVELVRKFKFNGKVVEITEKESTGFQFLNVEFTFEEKELEEKETKLIVKYNDGEEEGEFDSTSTDKNIPFNVTVKAIDESADKERFEDTDELFDLPEDVDLKQSLIDGINSLETDQDVTLVMVPECTNSLVIKDSDDPEIDPSYITIQNAMISHCEKMKNRFAVLDTKQEIDVGTITTPSSQNGFGAVYYPWLMVSDSNSSNSVAVPPSGHIAGVMARTDNDKGVHKAPANEVVKSILGVTKKHTEADEGILNEKNVNVIRPFTGRGVLVWGSRTISPSVQWRYVNVRRLTLYVEESIKRATYFAVFEPNNESLWATVRRQISGFLRTVWQNGALVGATAGDAYQIKIDSELNPVDQVRLGILNIQITMYPTTPAEFIVFSIIQKPGGPDIEE